MKNSFENNIQGSNLRELVVNTTKKHAQNTPYKLVIRNQSNSGPWVRAYMVVLHEEKLQYCSNTYQRQSLLQN
jgi:hypothetical protein